MSPSNLTRRRHCIVAVVVCTFTLAGTAPAGAAVGVADCPSQDVALAADNTGVVRAAILCLTNAERSQRGLVSVRENPKLRRAALAHSTDMVRAGYFAHTEPDGDTFVDRMVSVGYVRRYDGWTLGENLAWGIGDVETARGVHEAWMRSSGHRATILKPAYRELGIGVRLGIPKDARVGATFTTDFGAKAP